MNEEPRPVRALLSWLPLFLLGIVTAVAWAGFLAGGFRSIFAWLALQAAVPLLAACILLATIVRTIWKRRKFGRLAATSALAAFCLWPAAWLVEVGNIAYPFHLGEVEPTATVRVPTDTPMRVFWGGDDLAHNRHASFPDQRWAYDLAVDPVLTGSTRLEDHGCWGVPVVAPISGVVQVAHDGEPDHEPGQPSNDRNNPLGNHVAITLSGGGYLVVAHLRKGSVVAREGEAITEGAPLGACGNSGNTSEPHVHVHAQRQDPRGRPINFSEGLPLFFRDHDGAPMPSGGVDVVNGRAVPSGDVVRHVGARARAGAP